MDVLDSARVLNWMDMEITSRVPENTCHTLSHTLFPSIFFKRRFFFRTKMMINDQFFLPAFQTKMTQP